MVGKVHTRTGVTTSSYPGEKDSVEGRESVSHGHGRGLEYRDDFLSPKIIAGMHWLPTHVTSRLIGTTEKKNKSH